MTLDFRSYHLHLILSAEWQVCITTTPSLCGIRSGTQDFVNGDKRSVHWITLSALEGDFGSPDVPWGPTLENATESRRLESQRDWQFSFHDRVCTSKESLQGWYSIWGETLHSSSSQVDCSQRFVFILFGEVFTHFNLWKVFSLSLGWSVASRPPSKAKAVSSMPSNLNSLGWMLAEFSVSESYPAEFRLQQHAHPPQPPQGGLSGIPKGHIVKQRVLINSFMFLYHRKIFRLNFRPGTLI